MNDWKKAPFSLGRKAAKPFPVKGHNASYNRVAGAIPTFVANLDWRHGTMTRRPPFTAQISPRTGSQLVGIQNVSISKVGAQLAKFFLYVSTAPCGR